MTTQQELGRMFRDGATEGVTTSVEIQACDDGGHALVDTRGKGAVLAYRYPSGTILVFEGWYDYSTSTRSMCGKLHISPRVREDDDREWYGDYSSDAKPTTRTLMDFLDQYDEPWL